MATNRLHTGRPSAGTTLYPSIGSIVAHERPAEGEAPAYRGTAWARGVAEMAGAIAEGRPHRASGEQAAHIVDILEAAASSMADGGRAIIGSESFEVNAAPGRDLLIVMRTAQVVSVNILRPGGGGAEPLQFVESELDVRAFDRPAAHARSSCETIRAVLPGIPAIPHLFIESFGSSRLRWLR